MPMSEGTLRKGTISTGIVSTAKFQRKSHHESKNVKTCTVEKLTLYQLERSPQEKREVCV